MKKFLLKGILFFVIIAAICAGVLYLSTRKPTAGFIARWTDSADFAESNSLLTILKKAGKQDGKKILVIGDSVCRQLFSKLSKENPDACIAATNAAFMITGQYATAEEFLAHHPDATDVFLVMHPLALTRTFDLEWSYRYSVMLCAETDTLKYLDKSTIDTLASVYGRLFLNKHVVQMIEDSPVCRKLYLSYINLNGQEYKQSGSFEIADQYVKKLYERCAESGVTLHLYAAPVAECYREQIMDLDEEFRDTWIYSKYPDYISDIRYYPTEWSEDLSHFSGAHAERDALNDMIRAAYAGTALLEKLKLEKEQAD